MTENIKYQVLTNRGFKDFTDVVYKGTKKTLTITLENGDFISCTSNHKIYITEDDKLEAKFLKVGDEVFTKSGYVKIISISNDPEKKRVYDIVNVEEGNRFFANNILVSNCLDEFSFLRRNIQNEFMASAFPTINSGKTTKVIMITTPNGNELFAKIYGDAQKGLNDFKTFKAIWSDNPNRDEKWKKETIDAIGARAFRIEHECVIEGSAATVIPQEILTTLSPNTPILTEYVSKDNPESTFNVYEKPLPGAKYWLQVDPSEGKGGDFFTIQVIKLDDKFTQVATWKANDYNSEVFANTLYNLAIQYNNAFVCIETNGLGASVSDKMWDNYEYENLIFTKKNTKFVKYDLYVGAFILGSNKGIITTNNVKLRGSSRLERLLSSGKLVLQDRDTIEELNHFVRNGSSYAAEEGYHDDLVMPLVLFSWISENASFGDIVSDGEITHEDDDVCIAPVKAQTKKDNFGWDPIFWR